MTIERTVSNHPTLVLVCKRPALGHGKQRLAAQIGAEPALRIAERLLDCALEDLNAWPGATIISPDESGACGWAHEQAPQAICMAQGNGNLGERLNALDEALRKLGHQRLVFIGSDAPALTLGHYQRVCAALVETDTVLLGARDGGVVLMASNRPWPNLAALPWSSASLGQSLTDICRSAGHSVVCCGESFDIDEQADLSLAQRQLAGDPRAARRHLLQVLSRSSGAPP